MGAGGCTRASLTTVSFFRTPPMLVVTPNPLIINTVASSEKTTIRLSKTLSDVIISEP